MSLREKREFIQAQILETDHLLELAGDHPLMSPALEQRKAEFEHDLKELNETDVAQAFERVSAAETKDEMVEMPGIFRGATLDTWRFDFRTDGAENITGRLGDDVTHDQALEMIHLTDMPCVATFHRTLVKTRSGMLRTRYELTALRKAEAAIAVEK